MNIIKIKTDLNKSRKGSCMSMRIDKSEVAEISDDNHEQ